MRTVYLFLAAVAVVSSKPQRNKKDIIWYPVDDEDGVFISIYGEKYRTVQNQWNRSQRKVRDTQLEERYYNYPIQNRPSRFQKYPTSFEQIPYPNNPFFNNGRPQRLQSISENEYKDIINEVFGANNQPVDLQRPNTIPNTGWSSSTKKPKPKPRPTKPKKPTTESDVLVFPEEAMTTRRTTTTQASRFPTERPTPSPCERACPVTPEFNPVCGSDAMTYSNAGRLKCAQMCGKNVVLSHYGNCGRTPLNTPLLSGNPLLRPQGSRRF